MKKTILTAALLFAISPTAYAQEVQNGLKIEPGQTVLSLSATEQTDLKQDLLQASLRIEVEGKDAKKLQDEINKSMQKAVDLAKGVKEVKTSTGQYNVYSYDPNPQPPQPLSAKERAARLVWKGSQTIDLQSKDQAQLLDLVGKIQDMGFVMNGLNYALSPEQAEAYRDNLMTAALKKIQTKADLAAKALGKSSFDIIEVNVDGSNPYPPVPVMFKTARMDMAAGSAAPMAAPVAEAGEQTVSLSVTARVLLKP